MSICMMQAYGSDLLSQDSSSATKSNSNITQPIAASAEQKPSKDMVTIASQDIVMGNPQAKVVVIEYSSPTCPHCHIYHRTLFLRIKNKYINTGKIAYVMREALANKFDIPAATLMRCGAKREHSMHEKLLNAIFDLQKNQFWSLNYESFKSELIKVAEKAGISAEEYQGCLEDKEIQTQLLGHRKLLDSYESMWGTPMFFINGRRTIVDLDKEIHKAIEQSQPEVRGE